MRQNVTSRLRIVFLALSAALLAVSGASASRDALAPKPATSKQWAEIVAKAKKEGTVTLYTTQNPVLLADMAAKFKAKYGINVVINRNIDAVLAAQVTAEAGSGKAIADIWVCASKPLVLGSLKNGWVVDAAGPDLFAKAYDRAIFAKPGKAFVVGEAILGMAWNTTQFAAGLKDMPDVLKSGLTGRIGVISPSAPSIIDWYLWLQATYGKDFLPKLAALKPKKYPSSLPMMQAVASGEIAIGTFVPPTALDLKAQGAPIGFKLAKGFSTWNAPYYGMILKQAPHPAAAQLLANYMVTKEGQATSQRLAGSVLKDVPNTFYVQPRNQKLSDLTPQKTAAFQEYWNGLFK